MSDKRDKELQVMQYNLIFAVTRIKFIEMYIVFKKTCSYCVGFCLDCLNENSQNIKAIYYLFYEILDIVSFASQTNVTKI